MKTKRDVQSAGRLCLLMELDCNAFAGIIYAAATAMKSVDIACLEVNPREYLLVKIYPRLKSARSRSFATVPTSV